MVWYDSVVILSNPEMSKTQKILVQQPNFGSNFHLKMAKFWILDLNFLDISHDFFDFDLLGLSQDHN